jgi:glc operon protein GlcG
MYKREVLGLDEARVAVDAIIAEASKDPDRPIALAVVDDHGDLICSARMDKSLSLFSHMAMNKAYTAARMARDTLITDNRLRKDGIELAVWGDSRITTLQGGVCIMKPYGQQWPTGTMLGGIGVSGREREEDERLAFVGVKALNF